MRVATWNMDFKRSRPSHESAWRWLQETVRPDIALTQETVLLPNNVDQFVWREQGIDNTRRWASAVTSFSHPIEPIRHWRGDHNENEEDLELTFPGSVAIGKVEVPEAPVVVVSVYGLIDNGYAYTTVHRQLSDLNPILDSRQVRDVIIGGDLNCSTQLPNGRIHRSVFERLEAHGLVNLTWATRDHRPQLDNCPCEEGQECGHVQTYRHSREDGPWQDDYIFASQDLAGRLISCEVVDKGSPGPWGFSDHCPIVVTFEL